MQMQILFSQASIKNIYRKYSNIYTFCRRPKCVYVYSVHLLSECVVISSSNIHYASKCVQQQQLEKPN
jgi:hypothetical protein